MRKKLNKKAHQQDDVDADLDGLTKC